MKGLTAASRQEAISALTRIQDQLATAAPAAVPAADPAIQLQVDAVRARYLLGTDLQVGGTAREQLAALLSALKQDTFATGVSPPPPAQPAQQTAGVAVPASSIGLQTVDPPSNPEALDALYEPIASGRKDLKNPAGKVLAGKVHEQLNRAFYPMLLQLHERMKQLTPQQLTQAAREQLTRAPLQLGDYDYSGPIVGDGVAPGTDAHLLESVQHGNLNYPLRSLPGSATRFAYGVADPALRPTLGRTQMILGLTITPSGYYGDELAQDMALTTRLLIGLVAKELPELSASTLQKSPKLLEAETARSGRASQERTAPGLGPLATVAEGMVSVNQALSLLLMEKVPGAETGPEALRSVIFNGESRVGVVNELTGRIAMGVLGPATLMGRGFENQLEADAAGKLKLTDHMKEQLSKLSGMERSMSTQVGLCPMASHFLGKRELTAQEPGSKAQRPEEALTGIQLATQMYWQVFEAVHALREASSPEQPVAGGEAASRGATG